MPGWATRSKRGERRPWVERKRQAEQLRKIYRTSADVSHRKYAERMQWCARVLQGQWGHTPSGERAVKITNSQYCHVRYCPNCQAARTRQCAQKFAHVQLQIAEDYPDYAWLFLTVTIKNVAPDMVRHAFTDVLNPGFRRLTKRKEWPAIGWIASREVTRSKTHGDAHPHMHVLMLVPPEYFQDEYVEHSRWVELVQDALRLNYKPSVRISRVQGNQQLHKAVLETFKYTVKSQDMVADRDWCLSITDQTFRLRARSTAGVLREYLKNLPEEDDPIDDEAEEFEHLWFKPEPNSEPFALIWKPRLQDYVIQELWPHQHALPWGHYKRD